MRNFQVNNRNDDDEDEPEIIDNEEDGDNLVDSDSDFHVSQVSFSSSDYQQSPNDFDDEYLLQ